MKLWKPILSVIIVITIFGCDLFDGNTKERERISESISSIENIIPELEKQSAEIQRQKSNLAIANAAIDFAQQEAEKEIDRLKSQLSDYVRHHKFATIALIGGGGSATALIINDNLTENQRAILGVGTIIAAGYALLNSDEVKEVGVTIAQNGSEIAAVKAGIELGNKQFQENNNSINSLNAQIEQFNVQIASNRAQIANLKQKLQSLS